MKKVKKNFAVVVEVVVLEDDTWSACLRTLQGQLMGTCETPLQIHDAIVEISQDSVQVTDSSKS